MLSQTGLILWSAMVLGPYLTVHNSHMYSIPFSHNQKQPALLETKLDALYATALLGTKLDALYATPLLGTKLDALFINNLVVFVL